MRDLTQNEIDRALQLMNRSSQYRMTPTQAQEYLNTPYENAWAGMAEGGINDAHHDNMCLCARWSLWFFGA